MHTAPHSLARTLAALALSAGFAHAQTPISGALSDSTTGPLLAGVVYHATGSINVPLGETLTIQPGAIVKMAVGTTTFSVSGTLLVNGSSGSKVIFTSVRDDTAGGDTNGDLGATTPAKGNWRSINFGGSSDASALNWCEVRYAGNASVDAVDLASADITLSNCVVRDSFAVGLSLTANSRPAVTSCSFTNNNGVAVGAAEIDALPGFGGCTATGNGGNYIQVTDGLMTGDVALAVDNLIGGVLWTTTSITAPTGTTLTLDPGVVVKASGTNTIIVDGVLQANGTAGSPVVFTSHSDDTAAGDTNGDLGATTPAKGNWRGINFGSSADASTLTWCEVRYAGNASVDAVDLASADITLSNCTVRDSFAVGLSLSANSQPAVTSCAFTNNNGVAVAGARINALPGFSGCTASGNGGNYIQVTDGLMTGDVSLSVNNLIGNVLWTTTSITAQAGTTLTLGPGVVVKASGSSTISVEGVLHANGTAGSPVVFTSHPDDGAAGDTNGGGASSGAAGNWRGINFGPNSDASTLTWCEVRFAGNAGVNALNLSATDIAFTNCIVRNSAAVAMDLSASSRPRVRHSQFLDNGGAAVDSVELDAVPGFSFNSASGNGVVGTGGDYLRVTDATPAGDVTIHDYNCLGGALVLATSLVIPDARAVTLERGVVVKFSTGSSNVASLGRLDCNGSLGQPVVFTSLADDAFGGDTNRNGSATSPAPGNWRGIDLDSTDDGSALRNVVVRFAGNAGLSALECDSALASLDGVSIERAWAIGFDLSALARGRRLLARACGSDGLRLDAGSFQLEHVTSYGNADDGIDRESGSTATVTNSIAWGNVSNNFEGFAPGSLSYSNGDPVLAGPAGNINLDPLFVDAAGGDLSLAPGSPCIDSGDPLAATDPDGTRADMGALPTDAGGAPTSYCTGKTNSLGCVPSVDFVGFASVSSSDPFDITCHSTRNNKLGLFYYGYAPTGTPFQGGTKCVATPTIRNPIQNSGGNATGDDCSGVYSYAMNAHIQSGFDALLIVGANVFGQFWMRDPQSPSTTGLSDGIRFAIAP